MTLSMTVLILRTASKMVSRMALMMVVMKDETKVLVVNVQKVELPNHSYFKMVVEKVGIWVELRHF